ncbi:MAG: hypothetical protein J6K25_12575 [Thermoguttaceae bacterium]|nr:hypothetical protein [Thermoguttaceae bacterium]
MTALKRRRRAKRFDGGGDVAFQAVAYRDSGVDLVVVAPRSALGVGAVPERAAVPARPAGAAFLQLFAETSRRLSPDVVLTYGGYRFVGDMLKLAKKAARKRSLGFIISPIATPGVIFTPRRKRRRFNDVL